MVVTLSRPRRGHCADPHLARKMETFRGTAGCGEKGQIRWKTELVLTRQTEAGKKLRRNHWDGGEEPFSPLV